MACQPQTMYTYIRWLKLDKTMKYIHTYQIALKVSSSLYIKHGLKSCAHLHQRFFLLINALLRV